MEANVHRGIGQAHYLRAGEHAGTAILPNIIAHVFRLVRHADSDRIPSNPLHNLTVVIDRWKLLDNDVFQIKTREFRQDRSYFFDWLTNLYSSQAVSIGICNQRPGNRDIV